VYVTNLSDEERAAILLRPHGDADPGKGVLCHIKQGRKSARLTGKQRRHESGETRLRHERKRMLRVMVPGQDNATYAQLQKRMGKLVGEDGDEVTLSAKSSMTERFGMYLQQRQSVQGALRGFYERPVFRRHRYEAFCGRRASVDRFIARIKATFGEEVVLLYGNWGRNPNLKHQPPSPGVGLRRTIASHVTTVLVAEPGTSSRCPACEHADPTHPRRRPRWDHRTHQFETREVHHLLKCTNPTCPSPWWNRDVLGSANIGKTACHALHHGTWHPLFRFRADML
jgi:hypothetical protein